VTLSIVPHTLDSFGSPRRAADGPVAQDGEAGSADAEDPAVQRFVPSRDLMSLYANRLDGANWRHPRAAATSPVIPIPFGRAVWQETPVAEPAAAEEIAQPAPRPATNPRPRPRIRLHVPIRGLAPMAGLRRLVTAAFLVILVFAGFGQGALAQQRYRVQPGDTLWSVAEEFGVDPDAILAASWVADPPNLQPGDVIVIPDPGQSPNEAAEEAAANEGSSPWVAAAYYVERGDTIEAIAAAFAVDLDALIAFNGLDNPDLLNVGQRILIPATLDESTGEPVAAAGNTGTSGGQSSRNPAHPWVPTHQQERNLSCEYASVFIATSAFGTGIPESVFMDRIPQAENPHDGYRGDIDGRWGGYDDYGIYPEPLVSVLNDYGFAGEVFYGEYDPSLVKAHLDAGHPVIVWLALWGDTGVRYHDEGTYTVFAGEHVVVAYSYDSGGIYLSDPANATYKFMDWDTFLWAWGTSDGMSLAVYPG
jgi:LysM repeat protein/uncharacterized protein YvpB